MRITALGRPLLLREALLGAVGAAAAHLTVGTLSELTLAAGVLAGAVALAGQASFRRNRRS